MQNQRDRRWRNDREGHKGQLGNCQEGSTRRFSWEDRQCRLKTFSDNFSRDLETAVGALSWRESLRSTLFALWICHFSPCLLPTPLCMTCFFCGAANCLRIVYLPPWPHQRRVRSVLGPCVWLPDGPVQRCFLALVSLLFKLAQIN